MRTFIAFLLTLTLLHSTTIHGSIYSFDSFEKINGTLVKMQGNSSYQVLSIDGTYSFDVQPGEYNLTAFHTSNGKIDYVAYEKLSVGQESQAYDIVLFSPDFFDSGALPDLDVDLLPAKADGTIAMVAAALGVLGVAFFLARKYFSKKLGKGEMGEDEKAVIRILEENEGRMEQKVLREILKYSETKMSLLLTELEVSGSIRRFKKGRENIVKLLRKQGRGM